MASNIIYAYGSVQGLAIPAGESVVVNTKDQAIVFQVGNFPNFPQARAPLGTVVNGTTTFGPFTTAAVVDIVGGAGMTLYAVGTSPTILEQIAFRFNPPPFTVNVTGLISAAAMYRGIVTSTTAAAVAGTIPTGAVMELSSEFASSDSFDWSVIATGANAFTVTASASHTVVGSGVVASATSGLFRTVRVSSGVFVTYRLS
jgi:hypothetical protein